MGREDEALGPRTLSLGAPGIAGKTEGSFFFFLPARQRVRVHRNDERRRIGSDYDLASPQRKERDNDDDCRVPQGTPFMIFQLEVMRGTVPRQVVESLYCTLYRTYPKS